MQLVELSAEERRFLTSPVPPPDAWTPLLVDRLQRLLSARTRQQIRIIRVVKDALPSVTTQPKPEIRWDDALEALWVRTRLRTRVRTATTCAALSRNLRHTLEQALAETWRSTATNPLLPQSLHLEFECAEKGGTAQRATLNIRFPVTLAEMDRWAKPART